MMLIAYDRHTSEDLQIWRELHSADVVHGTTLDDKIRRSVDAIREFATSPCCCSVSFGKDSIVLLDLCMRASPQVPVRWVRWLASDNPDSLGVCTESRERWPEASIEWIEAPDDDHDDGRAGFRMLEKRHSRRLTGIRQDESSSRRVSAAVHGVATEKSCRPLLYWTSSDVFGYAARYDLPLHPVYAMSGGGRWSREYLRVDSLGGNRGRAIGRAEWEQEYYGDILNRMKHAQASKSNR